VRQKLAFERKGGIMKSCKFLYFGRHFFSILFLFSATLTAHAQTPVPSGLIGWWKGEGNVINAAGTTPAGTLKNGAAYAAGEVGQAFSLDGTDDYVEVPDNNLWGFGSNPFTIELWVNFDVVKIGTLANPGQVFVANDDGGFSNNKWFFALGAGVLFFHINDSAGSSLSWIGQISFSPLAGQWYHLAVTRNGTLYTFYVNGASIGTGNSSFMVTNPNAPLTIGFAEPAVGLLDGRIDEVSIYNRALNASEIQNIYNAGSSGKSSPNISSLSRWSLTILILLMIGASAWYLKKRMMIGTPVQHSISELRH
jgi:concanavalin A-like lectin/glucanase superfamily protein